MTPRRRLALRRETLAELRPTDLVAVAGAAPASGVVCIDSGIVKRLISELRCYSWHTEQC